MKYRKSDLVESDSVAELVVGEDGKKEWLIHNEDGTTHVLENAARFTPEAFDEGTQIRIYAPPG